MAFGLVIFVFVALSMVGAMVFTYRQLSLSATAWQEAAAALGLQSATSSMFSQSSMNGRVRDVDVRVHTEQRSRGGDNKTLFTIYTVNFFVDGPAVSIKRERGLGLMKRILQRTDVEIGDPAFDDALVIDCNDPEAARAFLTPSRRRTIYSLMQSWPTAELSTTRIMVANTGLETRSDRIISTINRLVDSAHLLGAPEVADAALELESQGDLAEGAAQLTELNATVDNAYVRLLEAQAQMALGEQDRVVELLDQVEPTLPADPEVMALRDMIDRAPAVAAAPPVASTPAPPPASPAGPSPSAAAAPTPPTAAASLGSQDVVADLFDSNRLGHEIEAHFDATYQGASIRWTGSVERVRAYRSDRDFGGDAGTKVTVLVGHLGDGRLVTSRVEAIVQLPADVEPERGGEIVFTGTLLRVDRFMRNIYVADGELVVD